MKKSVETTKPVSDDRRRFLKTASKVAVTAPAVALLLAAGSKPREAQAVMYQGPEYPWIP